MNRKNRRKRKTLPYPSAPSSSRRRCDEDHVGELRDWASLPRDVLCIVLGKLTQTDILRGAGLVCSHWRRIALHEPLLWRHIDRSDRSPWWHLEIIDLTDAGPVRLPLHKPPPAGWKAMAHAAADRSAGRCDSFRGHVDEDVLLHLADRSPLLRSLVVADWPYISDRELITEIIKELSFLERLVILSGFFQEELLVALLHHCPRLELLDVTRCMPTFRDWQEPIATTIRRSTIKHLLMPTVKKF